MLKLRYKRVCRNGLGWCAGLQLTMVRIKTFYLLVFCFIFIGTLSSQVLQHEIFNDELKSVRIYPSGQMLDMPIIPMNGSITVDFDDIGEYIRDLEYTIIHCNRDWTPSDLSIYEYIEGFDDATWQDFQSSRGTYVDYMHYELTLPNLDMQWKISGNYILKVWDRDNNDEVLMYLRFVVFETDVAFTRAELFRSTRSGFFDSHHELSFAIQLKDLGIDDPMRSITASAFQNHDWHTNIDSIKPRRLMREELFFDQHNDVVFAAMREYRLADLRTMTAAGYGVHEVKAYVDGINVTMETDELRGYENKFGNDFDINGGFVIDNTDNKVNNWEVEYAHTMFTLHYFNAPPDADVYILGPFNNYVADEASKMEFEGSTSVFYKELLLKQGVYDYVYAVKEEDGPIDYSITEGFDNRADNDYNVIIYYRPFLGKFDRVISYSRISR